MIDTVDGQLRVRSWPRARGAPKTKAQKERQDWFRDVQKAANYQAPQQMNEIIAATDGTPLLPRDIFTHMMSGRMLTFTLPNGRTLFPMAFRKEVSKSLDAISQTVGDMLIRTNEGWAAIPVTDIAGGGTPLFWPSGDWIYNYGDNTATKGVAIWPMFDTPIASAIFGVDCPAGARFQLAYYAMTGSNAVESIIARSPVVETPIDGYQRFEINLPAVLPERQRIFIALTRIDDGNYGYWRILGSGGNVEHWQGAPMGNTAKGYMVTTEPAIGQGISFDNGSLEVYLRPDESA